MSMLDRRSRLMMAQDEPEVIPEGTFTEFVEDCLVNSDEIRLATRRAVQTLIFEVWSHTIRSGDAGRDAVKQKLINKGMASVIQTALGGYARKIFNPAMSRFMLEMKDDNRINDAYYTGDDGKLKPDSCIIPTYADQGGDFILMYKMNISSIAKNIINFEKNLSGEIHEFHRCEDNENRHLVMINLTPSISYRRDKTQKMVGLERINFKDYEPRTRVRARDVPGSLEYKTRAQTSICDMKFDWHPAVIEAMSTLSFKELQGAFKRLGPEVVPLDTIDLTGLDRFVFQLINSYDPLNEKTLMALKEAPMISEPPADEVPLETEVALEDEALALAAEIAREEAEIENDSFIPEYPC